jgi:hypothetical protein
MGAVVGVVIEFLSAGQVGDLLSPLALLLLRLGFGFKARIKNMVTLRSGVARVIRPNLQGR